MLYKRINSKIIKNSANEDTTKMNGNDMSLDRNAFCFQIVCFVMKLLQIAFQRMLTTKTKLQLWRNDFFYFPGLTTLCLGVYRKADPTLAS